MFTTLSLAALLMSVVTKTEGPRQGFTSLCFNLCQNDFYRVNWFLFSKFCTALFFFKSSDRRMMRKQSKPNNPEYRMKYINVHRTIYFFFILMSCFILSKQLFIQQKYHECKIITLSDNYFEWPQRRTSEVYKNNVKWPIH